MLAAGGIEVRSRLHLSENAHAIVAYHRLLDQAQEKMRGAGKIGTTGRGIGGAYALTPSALDSSYEVRLNYRYSGSSSFGLALGRDLETLTPGLDSAANGERQLMFTGQHWLTPSWGLTYDLLSDEPGMSMRVQGLRLGVRYRF